jgi:L-lactate dehydrogenase complex protein LldG
MASSSARDVILKKLRSSAADSQSLFRTQPDPELAATVPSAVTNADGVGLALAKTFGENLSAVLGSYEIVDRPSDVVGKVVNKIESWRNENDGTESYGSEVLSWAPDELPIRELSNQLQQNGISLFVPTELRDEAARSHAASLNVGITGVDAAFAGTGSMVLIPGGGKSRVASLLPLHHIALVPVSKIYPTLESWLASLRDKGTLEGLFRDHAQLVFVTGPSKSADIELNLTLGVHGPKDVHAVIFDDGR